MEQNTNSQAYTATGTPDLLRDIGYTTANANSQHANADLTLGMDHSNPNLTEDHSSNAEALASSSLPLTAPDMSGMPGVGVIENAENYGYEHPTMRILADIERGRQATHFETAVHYREVYGHLEPGLPRHIADQVNAHLQQQQAAREAGVGTGMLADMGIDHSGQQHEQAQQSTSLVDHVQGLQHEQSQDQGQGQALDLGQAQVGQDLSGQEQAQGNGQEEGAAAPPQFYKKRHKLVMACHFCRRRKLKCDGDRPQCSNCHKRSEPCLWDDVVRRRGPGKRTKGMHPEHYDEDGNLLPEYMSKQQRKAAGLNPDGSIPEGGLGSSTAHAHEYDTPEGHEGTEHAMQHHQSHEQSVEGDAQAHAHDLASAHTHEHSHEHTHQHSAEGEPGGEAVSAADTNAALIAAVAAAARDVQDMDGVGVGVGVGAGVGMGSDMGVGVEGGYDDLNMTMPDEMKFQIDPALAEGGINGGVYDPAQHGDSSAIDGSMDVGAYGDNGLGQLQTSQQQQQQQQGQEGHGIGVGVGVGYGGGSNTSQQALGQHGQEHEHEQGEGEGIDPLADYEYEEDEGAEDPFAAF